MREATVLVERLVRKLDEAISTQKEQILSGGVEDYSTYQYLVGGLEAMQLAQVQVKEQYRILLRDITGEDDG